MRQAGGARARIYGRRARGNGGRACGLQVRFVISRLRPHCGSRGLRRVNGVRQVRVKRRGLGREHRAPLRRKLRLRALRFVPARRQQRGVGEAGLFAAQRTRGAFGLGLVGEARLDRRVELFRRRLRGREFRLQRGEAVALFETRGGGRRRLGAPHEPIPAPHIAGARDEANAWRQMFPQRWAARGVDNADQRQARGEFRRRRDVGRQGRSFGRQFGRARRGARPTQQRARIERSEQIVAQRGGECALIAGRGAHRAKHGGMRRIVRL